MAVRAGGPGFVQVCRLREGGQMKGKRWYCDICIILIYLSAAAGLLLIKDVFTIKTENSNIQLWDEGWTAQSASPIPVAPGDRVKVKANQPLVLKNTIPATLNQGTYLCFRSTLQHVRVWVADRLVYEYGKPPVSGAESNGSEPNGSEPAVPEPAPIPLLLGQRLCKAPDSAWNYVYLSNRRGGEVITLELTSPYTAYSGLVRPFYLGRYDAMQKHLVRTYFPGYVAGLGLFVLGAAMVILAIFFRRKGVPWEMSLYLGLFTGAVALWIMCESKIPVEYWYLDSKAISTAALLGASIFYVRYLDLRTGRRYAAAFRLLLRIVCAVAAVIVLLAVGGVADLVETTRANHLVIAAVILFTAYVWLREWRGREQGEASLSARRFKTLRLAGIVGLMAAVILESAVFHLDEYYSTGVYIQTAMTLYILILFVNFANDMLEERKRAARLDLELEESRVKMMLSQIQPHFLYNTLLAIQELCYTDPIMAADTIVTFADYLRGNMDFLEDVPLVPFRDELSHVENYMEIQKVRFGDELRFELRLTELDFLIPPLSLQPLVENAVQHGLRGRSGNGTVRLSAERDGRWITVRVEDDGCGFDVKEAAKKEGFHALDNVEKRMKKLLSGSMTVESEIGRGTRVTLVFPCREEAKDERDRSR